MENCEKYFLGANSAVGFVNLFGKSYNPYDGWKAYIIKGGPGTGKSSFMKLAAKKMNEKGIKTILCPCSSDPNSLDAVIFPTLKKVIMDGTAPHVVEPVMPGICDCILNFGQFWDENKFDGSEEEILSIFAENSKLHKTASRYIKAAGQIMNDNYKTALACTDADKTLRFARTLCKKYIEPSSSETGYEWVRFIGGVTPLGIVSYSNTLVKAVDNLIVLSDDYGAASGMIMEHIRNYALLNGHEIITLKNPFLPDTIIDHIIIPSLSLAFVTENDYIHFDCDSRRIHARRFTNTKSLHNSRQRIAFNKKAFRRIMESACSTLANAKQVHDKLEKYYISAMNFDKLSEFADDFIRKL